MSRNVAKQNIVVHGAFELHNDQLSSRIKSVYVY